MTPYLTDRKKSFVIEALIITESQLNQYCRKIGIFKEQIQRWKQDCLSGFQSSETKEIFLIYGLCGIIINYEKLHHQVSPP